MVKIEGRFYVLGEKALGGTGFTVRDHSGRIIYRLAKRSDAQAAANRLNEADKSK